MAKLRGVVHGSRSSVSRLAHRELTVVAQTERGELVLSVLIDSSGAPQWTLEQRDNAWSPRGIKTRELASGIVGQ